VFAITARVNSVSALLDATQQSPVEIDAVKNYEMDQNSNSMSHL
jgi:hypothetical protein